MIRHIGESREVLTEDASDPTNSGRMLRVSRRTGLILGGVFLCAAAAVGVAVYALSPSPQSPPLPPSSSETRSHAEYKKPIALPTPPPSIVKEEEGRGRGGGGGGAGARGLRRLPTNLKPSHYTVKLQPFIDGNFSIFGSVEVEFEVMEETSDVVLNIYNIITHNDTVKVVSLNDPGSSDLSIEAHLYNHTAQTYTAKMTEALHKGQRYLLSMDFEGYLNNDLAGFYRSTYTDEEGNRRYLAVSQFEPEDARRAFPCFDEPELKATFDVHLAREESKSSISNMPLWETVPVEGQAGWVWDIFNTSVPMSTYLVAFVVSDFVYVESDANDHVHFRVWARKEAIHQAQYALSIGPDILTIYENYFNVPFPLPKQDMIALPDFAAGAMENWGLITYRETLLLINPQDFAASDKASVATVVAHELGHQWFGNLVTLKWWNDLWLNEGFATFASYIGTSHLKPEWKTMEKFVPETLQAVMELDSLESSHPISVEVDNPNQVNELFDDISYSKGSSIIRMMMYFLTEDNFKKGLHNYLVDRQYSNAEQDDLWQFMTEAVEGTSVLPEGVTVKDIMDTWTLQKGFPVLKVERDADGTSATVTQDRFLLVRNPNSTDDHEYRWWIPVTHTHQDDPSFNTTGHTNTWMADTDKQITVSSLPTSDKWVIFNVQETSYYKVNYDDNNWQLLTTQLDTNHALIHELNRAQLIDDSFDLARANELSYNTALSLVSYLKKEEEFFPWSSALSNLDYLEEMFTRMGGYGDLRTYLMSLLEPLYNLVGFHENENDPMLVHDKRYLALRWTCKLGYKDCVDNSVSLFQAWVDSDGNSSVVPPNVRSTVYCMGVAEGGEDAWNFAWRQYLSTNVANERGRLLSALGCAKEVWILSRYLEIAFTEGSGIRKQDASSVFQVVARNDIGRDLAWNYLRDHFEDLTSFFGSFTTLGDLVLGVSQEFNTRQEEYQLELFKEEHADHLGTAKRAVDQAIEITNNNIAWMDANYQTIEDWLQDHLHPDQSPASL